MTFQLEDNSYCVTILYDIQQYRGRCTYEFGMVFYKGNTIPTKADILNAEIIGRKIPSGAERTGSFVIGMDKTGVEHKDLINFTDRFHKIGNIKIKTAYKETGSIGIASRFDEFIRLFPDLDNYIKIFKADKFKVKELMEE